VRAFAFFDGVAQSVLYDNTKIAVARILGDGKRQRTRVFSELQSHICSRTGLAVRGRATTRMRLNSPFMLHWPIFYVHALPHGQDLPL
jgi:transposase